jgi:hypothetical protein
MRRLRKNAPLRVPVRLVQRRGVRCSGEWVLGVVSHRRRWLKRGGWSRPTGYLIVIDERMPLGEKWAVVIHEYAHCLDREKRWWRVKDCHDSVWGRCYSRALRATIREK